MGLGGVQPIKDNNEVALLWDVGPLQRKLLASARRGAR